MSSVSTFNGDIFFSARGPNGGLYMVIGDFTGHGLSASMGTLPVAQTFFELVNKGVTVEYMARTINGKLHEFMPANMFFSAIVLFLNHSGEILTVWQGGMPYPYWISKSGELKGRIKSRNLPLGIPSNDEFSEQTVSYKVNQGDKIYFYTDGITEARNFNGEQFGDERLEKSLSSHDQNRIEYLLQDLEQFKGIGFQEDDITIVELTCTQVPAMDRILSRTGDDQLELPWKLTFTLTEKEIQNEDSISQVTSMIVGLPQLADHAGEIQVLLSEM